MLQSVTLNEIYLLISWVATSFLAIIACEIVPYGGWWAGEKKRWREEQHFIHINSFRYSTFSNKCVILTINWCSLYVSFTRSVALMLKHETLTMVRHRWHQSSFVQSVVVSLLSWGIYNNCFTAIALRSVWNAPCH